MAYGQNAHSCDPLSGGMAVMIERLSVLRVGIVFERMGTSPDGIGYGISCYLRCHAWDDSLSFPS